MIYYLLKAVKSTSANEKNIAPDNGGKMILLEPRAYSESQQIADHLKKKNTVTITSEGKVFIIIIIVLLLFIFIMPYIFDAIRNANH